MAHAPKLPAFEFAVCGIDKSLPAELAQEIFGQAEAEKDKKLGLTLIPAFQLAYQGYPWKESDKYKEGSDPSKRRYGGLSYPAFYEIREFQKSAPLAQCSFHLNQTGDYPYVENILKGADNEKKLVKELIDQYKAHHIQINLSADGVPGDLFMDPEMMKQPLENIRNLCREHEDTIFVIPFTKKKGRDGSLVDSSIFINALLAKDPPKNLCVFYDSSAGTGKEPDKAPELPDNYPRNQDQPVGFTGGIDPSNVKRWLDQYLARANQFGCNLLSDAQSGFRQGGDRGKPIDERLLRLLIKGVRQWCFDRTEIAKAQKTPLEVDVEATYGKEVLESVWSIWFDEALPQVDTIKKDFFLKLAESSPQFQKDAHPDDHDRHLREQLCKLILYCPEVWYEVVTNRPRPSGAKTNFQAIGVAFDASSRLRRAGLEYYHKKLTNRFHTGYDAAWDTPGVFFIEGGEKSKNTASESDGISPKMYDLTIAELNMKEKGTNRLRVVTVADTHAVHAYVPLPEGDLLVHAGDMCYEESRSYEGDKVDKWVAAHPLEKRENVEEFFEWFEKEPFMLKDVLTWMGKVGNFEHRILIGGNHDYILEKLELIDLSIAKDLCKKYNVTLLSTKQDPLKLIFKRAGTQIHVWGSGISAMSVVEAKDPRRAVKSGNVAYQVGAESQHEFEKEIAHLKHVEKGKIDIILTHAPPEGVLNGKKGKTFMAINDLIKDKEPKLYVCGHAHNESDLKKGRFEKMGKTLGVNACILGVWNQLHGRIVVVDLPVTPLPVHLSVLDYLKTLCYDDKSDRRAEVLEN